MKAVQEMLKTMIAGRMQAGQGDHIVITCSNLKPHFSSINTND